MKKLLNLITIVLIAFSAKTFSQENTTESKAQTLTKSMQSQINFNDSKFEKVKAINLDFINKTENLKTQSLQKFEKLKQLKKIDEVRDNQLKEVFTAEEFDLFKQNKSKNRKALKTKFKESQQSQ